MEPIYLQMLRLGLKYEFEGKNKSMFNLIIIITLHVHISNIPATLNIRDITIK